MEKITIKELIEFRGKSGTRKKKFADKLKTKQPKVKVSTDENGGGDYWISSTSCIQNVFKSGDKDLYDDKIDDLHSRDQRAQIKHVKEKYQRNIDILMKFKDFELDHFKPHNDLLYQKVEQRNKILTVDGIPLYVAPGVLFSFEQNGRQYLGAIWLVPKLDGFTKDELGMFCEMLYRYMVKNYSDVYQISEEYCVSIDTFNAKSVRYTEFVSGAIPYLIDSTLKELSRV
jgi:hypothetical protein